MRLPTPTDEPIVTPIPTDNKALKVVVTTAPKRNGLSRSFTITHKASGAVLWSGSGFSTDAYLERCIGIGMMKAEEALR